MHALRRKGLTGHPERKGCRERQVGTSSVGPESSPEAHLDTPSGDAHGSQGLVLRNLEPHPHPTSPLCFQGPPSPCHPQTLENRSREAGVGGERDRLLPHPREALEQLSWLAPPAVSYTNHFSLPGQPQTRIILQTQKLRLREVQPLCFSQDLGSTAHQLQAGWGGPFFQWGTNWTGAQATHPSRLLSPSTVPS